MHPGWMGGVKVLPNQPVLEPIGFPPSPAYCLLLLPISFLPLLLPLLVPILLLLVLLLFLLVPVFLVPVFFVPLLRPSFGRGLGLVRPGKAAVWVTAFQTRRTTASKKIL